MLVTYAVVEEKWIKDDLVMVKEKKKQRGHETKFK